MARLDAVDPTLLTRIQHLPAVAAEKGLLPIPITGFRGTLHDCLRDGCRRALEPLGDHPVVRALLEDDFFTKPTVDSRAVMAWFPRFQQALGDPALGYGGCLLVVDEMGKLLEYAAIHPTEVDLYLLQELAEFANRSGAIPVVIVGILHQSFERYAGHLDASLRDRLELAAPQAAAGVVLLCLVANPAETETFVTWAKGDLAERVDVVVGINPRTEVLAKLCIELRSLQWVKEHTPGLRDDPVARREVRARFHQLESLIRIELDRTLTPAQWSDGAIT